MNHIRFRRILEVHYREYRKIGGYFDRKDRKQGFKVWKRARKSGMTTLEFHEFYFNVMSAGSRGITYREMLMNNKALDRHFRELKETKPNE